MKVGIISLFPEMFDACLQYGVTGRAITSDQVNTFFYNPRDYTNCKHHNVDDRPYGGGPGMVMQVSPILGAVEAAKATLPNAKVAFVTPKGQPLKQKDVSTLSKREEIIFIAGRYEGIDERLIDLVVDEQWSLGDYVLSGGELAIMVMLDAMIRLIPGVLGDEQSVHQDSFGDDSFCEGLLDFPHYTRPPEISGMSVPEVLLQGDHEKIRRWRLKQSLGMTWLRRPDLLENRDLSEEEAMLLTEFKEQYRSGYE